MCIKALLPSMKDYDLIVIGTGSAMNIVEPMIQDNPNIRIAVIDKDDHSTHQRPRQSQLSHQRLCLQDETTAGEHSHYWSGIHCCRVRTLLCMHGLQGHDHRKEPSVCARGGA